MRIREIFFSNFRSFRGERRISFVDSLTDTVRPVSVLAGSNGTGKTTILEAVRSLLAFVLEPDNPTDLVVEALETGLICLALELFPDDVMPEKHSGPEVLHIAVGQRDLAPASLENTWPNLSGRLVRGGMKGRSEFYRSPLAETLFGSVSLMYHSGAEPHGGLLYFPHDRQFRATTRPGPIERPPREFQWNWGYSNAGQWKDSLEQFWVWQNYLDLEEGALERKRLKRVVSIVENVLGQGRSITVKEGLPLIPVSWGTSNGDKIRLDQLPSGEQQVILLFGELARRMRRGAVIAIDEVENCLHPTLQRLVMWNLRQLAHEWDAQVIVTTHSLEVIKTVRGGAFINLDYPPEQSDFSFSVSDESDAK